MDQYTSIVTGALAYANDFFNANHHTNLVFHNYQHASTVVEIIQQIASNESILTDDRNAAQLAAIFYNIGFANDPNNFSFEAINAANNYIDSSQIDQKLRTDVHKCLKVLDENNFAASESQKLFLDGINAHELASNLETSASIQKMEMELIGEKKISNISWNEQRLNRLLKTKFHFPYTKINFEPNLANSLLTYKQKVERNKLNGPKGWDIDQLRNFQSIERKIPNSANQTFFRTNYRNHINLSAIADNKANIMISVNAILISVLISVLSYRNITETNPKVLMPVVIFLFSGLASLVFAVLSARPKVTRINEGVRDKKDIQKNITFFGNFVGMKLEEYEEAMDGMLRDSELVYGNMTRDLYYLGQVLDRKYRFLTMSYNIFMVGFAATVLTFMVALLG